MSEKNLRRLKKVFYALIVIFILNLLMSFATPLIVGMAFTEEELEDEDFEVPVIFVILNILTMLFWLLYAVLGAVLIYLTLKKNYDWLKIFYLKKRYNSLRVIRTGTNISLKSMEKKIQIFICHIYLPNSGDYFLKICYHF